MRSLSLALLTCVAVAVAPGCKKKSSSNPTPVPTLSNPTVTGVTPPDDDVAGGVAITIQGTDFLVGAQVSIGGSLAANVSVASSTQITANAPSGTVGPANVVVTNPDSQVATLINGFTYTASTGNNPPVFSSVTPTSGPAGGGTLITITGTGFYSGAAVTVGGGAATGVTVVSGTTITCTTPSGTAGAQDIVVTNADTQFDTGTGAFTYVNPPAITGFTPSNGPQAGGITVTIGGTDFVSPASVTFNGSTAPVTSFSGTALEVTLPVSATSGLATVVVTNPDTQSDTDTTGFTYDPPPNPTGVNPNNGPLAGGNTVTVNGTNFVSGGGLAVTFGGSAATAINFLSSTQIECQPPLGSGLVSVVVTNPDGQTGTATNAYTYNPLPTITSIQPNSGPLAGGNTVTINGANYLSGPNPTVTFGGLSAPVTLFGVSALEVTVPTGVSASAVDVVVLNRDGQSVTSTNGYTYTSGGGGGLTVTNVTPSSGTTAGGTPMTITGTGFLIGATVTINGNTCGNVMVTSATNITCTSAAGTGTGHTVTVNNPGGGNASWSGTWSYVTSGTTPTISNISPATGTANGNTGNIVITAANFGTSPAVTINGQAATVTGTTASTITVTMPNALHCVAGGAQLVYVTDTTTGETSTGFSGYTYTPDLPEALSIGMGVPDVTIDGSANIHVVFQTNPTSGNNDIQYRRSTDGGQTWGNGGITNGRVTQTTNNSVNARIAASGSTVVIVWMEMAGPTTIDYVYSTDNGANFTTIASLPTNANLPTSGGPMVGFPDVTIGSSGTVHAIWLEASSMALSSPVAVYGVSATVANLGTATVNTVSGGGSAWAPLSIDASGTTNVVAAWPSSTSSMTQATNIRSSYDTGSGWVGTVPHSGTNPITGVAVALHGTNTVLAYIENATGAYSVDSYTSANTGTTWTAGGTLRTGGSGAINNVDVDADAGGFFTAVWSEVGSSQTDIWCTLSSDVGVNWSTALPFAPSTTASTLPRIAGGATGNWSTVWGEFNAANNGGTGGLDIVHW